MPMEDIKMLKKLESPYSADFEQKDGIKIRVKLRCFIDL